MKKALFLCIPLATLATSVCAAYPEKNISLIIPHVAGGGTDVFARMVAEQLSKDLGVRFIPENKPGAGTALAAGLVAKAKPDGYTLLFNTAAHVLNAAASKNHTFHPTDDFEFVGKIGEANLLLVINTQKKDFKNIAALVNELKATDGTSQYASAGQATPMHFGGELFLKKTGTKAIHVPYKGEAAALNDLMGKQFTFMYCSVPTCSQRLDGSSLKALAIASKTRSPLAPQVPTLEELGIHGAEVNSWFFMAAPKSTPENVIEKLNASLKKLASSPEFIDRSLKMGIEVNGAQVYSPAQTKEFIKAEIKKWKPIADEITQGNPQ